MAVGPISGAAQAYSSAYSSNERFMGLRDPAYALKYKGPKQAAKWARKEEKYGAYPETARTIGQIGLGLLKDSPEEFYKKFPGLELYDDKLEGFMADPLAEQATGMRDTSRAGLARYAGRNNLGPEFSMMAMARTGEEERGRIAGSRRQSRLTRVLGNRENAMKSAGFSEDLFGKRYAQKSENEWNYASGMASYAQALQSEEMLRRATSAQNNQAWMNAGGQFAGAVTGGISNFFT